ncbi:MAG TPA: hypothetical protein PLE74_03610 [Candidatus Cloacimonadota bacterium]|nr:hypothetical protein [Candidatus Cloacimonadota bacterium]HPT71346.1 hypothetical protein [Candidatus Cloacimonadota bacterium]
MYWKKTLIYLCLLGLMAAFMMAAQDAGSKEQQIVKSGKFTTIRGILNRTDSLYTLQTDSVKVILYTAPEEYLEKRGLALSNNDTLNVSGYYSDGKLLVSTIQKANQKVMIRSELGTPYVITNDQKTYASNPAICIGTTLCAQNCPTNAITMVKGKAVTDPSKCISCGICENGNGKNFKGCPVKAIHPLK